MPSHKTILQLKNACDENLVEFFFQAQSERHVTLPDASSHLVKILWDYGFTDYHTGITDFLQALQTEMARRFRTMVEERQRKLRKYPEG